MKLFLLLAALAAAEEKPLDKANASLEQSQKSVKSGAKKLESDTNKGLEKARKKGRKGARDLEKAANDAAREFRKKVGTEK